MLTLTLTLTPAPPIQGIYLRSTGGRRKGKTRGLYTVYSRPASGARDGTVLGWSATAMCYSARAIATSTWELSHTTARTKNYGRCAREVGLGLPPWDEPTQRSAAAVAAFDPVPTAPTNTSFTSFPDHIHVHVRANGHSLRPSGSALLLRVASPAPYSFSGLVLVLSETVSRLRRSWWSGDGWSSRAARCDRCTLYKTSGSIRRSRSRSRSRSSSSPASLGWMVSSAIPK